MTGAAVLGSSLSVSGITVLNSTLSVGGASQLTGAAVLGGSLSVSGITVLNSTLSVGGASRLTGAAVLGSSLSVSGITVLGSTLSVSGLSYFSSNVGIGTSTISYRHHVYGAVDEFVGYFRQVNSGGSGVYIDSEGTGTTTPLRIRTTAAGNILWVQSNGNIGMGTISPAAPLHIASSVSDTFTWLSYIDSGTSWVSGDPGYNVSLYCL